MFRGALITLEGLKHGYFIPREMKFEESRIDFCDFFFSQTFFNAHTHIADSSFMEAPRIDLKALVAPGGYKHRMLEKASLDELREDVMREVEFSRSCGTSFFLDFREGGMKGLKVVENIKPILPLARPLTVEEAEKIESFGFAYSSTRDHDFELLQEVKKIAKKKKKIFAIHAGEIDCGDVEKALELEPDLIIHMNMCEEMLNEVLEMEIPVVSCIRSNAFFGITNLKVYRKLSEYDLWLLGTDNAMISSTSMLDEMHFSSYLLGCEESIFKAATLGFEIFKVKSGFIVFNRKFNFKKTNDPLKTLVRRAVPLDIEAVFH
ncbi:MAG: amidohydrolase [Archaeoglobaceae archaeon]|nr:amidohydrolase [Archaeoglobaceae archaeon]MCX8152452.1 amidohydrolase [Archaeoglobaceae archaeon]MDW8013792.1 amidohydrolase [Archaeoglobaceae archaeon]